ncbi:MAG: Ig domain-containing protein, partial [Acidimicrobiia bacterium]|nr:Ig domain-containing protein [Acidimicrobiia bacterium]
MLAPYIVGSQAGPAAAASGTCYLIGGAASYSLSVTDLANTDPATNEATIGWSSSSGLSTAAIQPGTGELLSAGTSKLGRVDTGTGTFTEVGSAFGPQPGAAGNQNLNQVTGLAFDPTDTTLFAVARRIGGPDLLFQVDPGTGAAIPDAFGLGAGYVGIISDDPSQFEFYGIAIAADGQMVGMGYDGTSQWKLHTIDKETGAALAVLSSSAVTDLSYDPAGILWGVASDGILFDVYGVEPSRTIDNLVSYSALACLPVAGNQTPFFAQDLGDRSDPEGANINLSAGATDANLGDTLVYAAVGLPSGLTIAPDTGLITGTVGAGAAASSPYSVSVTVTDDGTPVASATDTFTWTITEQNQTPTFNQNLPDRADTEGTSISLSAAASDPDMGDTLGYSATNLPPGLTVDSGSGLISGTITYVASGSYAVTVTVTDDGTPNASATDT